MAPGAVTASRDVPLLFASRAVRLFAFGFLSVVLVLHLSAAGLSERRIGLLLTLTLVGDTAISLWVTTRADRLGRRRMLGLGALLMAGAGALLSFADGFALLLLAATLGIVSPAGNEVGPFLALEQAALSQGLPPARRTSAFAWYALAGSLATAGGALAAGLLAEGLQRAGLAPLAAYRAIAGAYGALGLVLLGIALALSPAVEAAGNGPSPGPSPRPVHPERSPRAARAESRGRGEGAYAAPPAATARPWLGLHRSRGVVLRLSGLFALDAFAGGFIVQSFVAFWFQRRFGSGEALLGAIFFCANVLAGLSALSAAAIARRIGLVATMVATHLPSNVLLLLVPLMPTLPLAAGVLLLRYSISQMDVPTRQSYTMAVVDPSERSAAAGVTGIARTVGSSLSPLLAGPLYASPALWAVPFFLCGGLKIAYDLLLWRAFRAVKPEGER